MCYYDHKLWDCGWWSWDGFREQCNKENHIGETCGLKLVYRNNYPGGDCLRCRRAQVKGRRLDKLLGDVARWRSEGDRPATIERALCRIRVLDMELGRLQAEHDTRKNHIY
jgi:hypothetical protein